MSLDGTTEDIDEQVSDAQVSDAEEAAHARDMAAVQMQRAAAPRNRRSAVEPAEPLDTPEASKSAEPVSPYAQFAADPPDDGVSFLERMRLNRQDAFYRGTLAGSSRLAILANLVQNPDGPEVDPDRRRVNDALREEYRGVVSDLAAYDLSTPWGDSTEGAAALAGQLGGSLMSPESFLGWGAKAATMLGRVAKAAVQQGAIQAVVDPVVQTLGIAGGVEDEYNPYRTATAAGLGALIGGGGHAMFEGLEHVLGPKMIQKTVGELGAEDPAFVGATAPKPAELTPEAPGRPAGETSAPGLPGEGQPEKTNAGPAPGALSSGEPHVDQVLADPDVADAIANPKVNRTQDVPYTAGPDKTGNGLNIDKHFPESFTVDGKTFDPAQPFAVHEFTERAAMDKLITGGMDEATAYKVAHWEVAEKAEGAWYQANGIDQAKAEAAYQPYIDQIEHEKLAKGDGDVPPDLFKKPYPHDNVDAAAGEKAPVPKPTADEIAKGRAILEAQAPAAASPAPQASSEIAGKWEKTGGQKGTNPGGTYEDELGTEWYVKTPQTEDHARNEVLGNELYRMAGADVPEVKLVTVDGKPAVASRILHGAAGMPQLGKLEKLEKAVAVKKLRADFAADAWLANHDVIGLKEDNVLVNPLSGTPTRIDQGGALRYRAQGEPKEGFGSKVNEFETMRDPKIAPQAAAVFKGMTKQQLVDSINKVLLVPTKDIQNAVAAFGPTDPAEAGKLVDTLLDRQAHLAQIRQDLVAKPAKPTAGPTPVTVTFKKGGGVVQFPKSGEAPKAAAFTFPAESVDKAKALGFHLPGDTGTELDQKLGKIWFHGTHSTFDRFDLAHTGQQWGQKKEKAVFLTPETKVAKAAAYGGQILPLVTRVQKVMIVPGPQYYSGATFAAKIQEAHAKGYDAVLFEKTSDFGGVAADQLAVLKPNMIRSIHAQFEPKNVKSAKLAAVEGQKPGAEPAEASTSAQPGGLAPEEFDRQYEEMLADAHDDMVEAQERGVTVTQPTTPEELQAIAQRKGGATLAMEQKRPATGVAQGQAQSQAVTQSGQAGVPATVPAPPSPEQATAIRSMHQQVLDLAEALDIPVREGRVQLKNALATFNTETGVARTREIADFEAVAHEAGHHIEARVGSEMTALTQAHAVELGPLDYDYPKQSRPAEGFAEYIRRSLGNPAHAQQVAPGFTIAFRNFMQAHHPDILASLDRASASYRSYLQAPSHQATGSTVRFNDEEGNGWQRLAARLREEGFPAVIKSMLQGAYAAVLDDKAPVARAVRDLGRLIREQTGELVDLKAADNPEVLLRMRARANQAATRDMMDGVRPYRAITPEGPSLADAITKAVGAPSVWGKWDREATKEFSRYLVDRRAEVLWDKYDAGDLPNPPVSFSKADAMVAIAERERANPNFRDAAQMVHDYTRQLLRKQYEGGLVDADLYDKLVQEKFYVPMMRDMSDKPMAAGAGGSSAQGPGLTQTVKRMKGSSRDEIDPLESLMTQTFLVNRTLRHNDVIRSFVDLAGQAKGEGGRYVEPIPAHEAAKYTVNVSEILEKKARDKGIDPTDAKVMVSAIGDQLLGEDPIMGSFFRMEQAGKRGEPIIFYKDGGRLKAARFMAEKEGLPLYETLMQAPEPVTDLWVDLIRGAAVIKRSGIIANPTFALSNYLRDQFALGILRSDYIPIASGMKGIVAEFRQSDPAKLYAYSGGVAGGASTGPVEKAAEAEIDALAKKGYLVNRVTSFKGLLELASFTEAGSRNSVFSTVFEAKKKQGLSDYEAMVEAASQAQDILDFSRHGSRTLMIRQLLPFINAHMQGLDKAWRTIVEPLLTRAQGDQVFARESAEFKNAVAAATKVGALGGALGALWAAVNWEKEAYRDASPYFKGTHLIVPFGDKLILMPKPFELGLGFTAGEYAFARFAGDDPRAAGQFLDAAWQALGPPNVLTDIPGISTAIELYLGKSIFTNRDIVPANLQRFKPEEQYNERTSALAKWIGQTIGVSPMKVEFGIGDQFGTWGRDIMALSQGVDQDSPALNMEDRVFLRRFIKDPTRTSDITTTFWNAMAQTTGTYNQDVATFGSLVKQFQDGKAQDFLGKLPAPERAFVTLKTAAREDGKAAFNADEKRLHPLQRAYDAVSLLNGLRRELANNSFRDFETLTRLQLDPEKRRDLMSDVRELAQMEMRNALVIIKAPGYANRPVFDVNDVMGRIAARSPQIANEIATRYATAKIYTTDAVAKAWPKLSDEVNRMGSEADIAGLAFDAKGDGYEFGGERVKRPAPRRVPVPAAH